MIDNDRTFAIAYGKNRTALHWKQSAVTWGEIRAWMNDPVDHKDTTGYVLGTLRPTTRVHSKNHDPCTGIHRVKDGVESRSVLALDIDSPSPDFLDRMDLTFPYAAIMHTTYSSAPDAPRYRLLIPTDRAMAPDEYIVAAKQVMSTLGESQFDSGSDQPERFMYKPAAQERSWFHFWEYDGEVAQVSHLLRDFDPDLSTKTFPPPTKTKRNPFEIEGVIGAFNRAYEDWDLLISTYELPYEKVSEDRYHLVGSASEAGMGPMAGATGFMYSHHTSDPAYGRTCSAFDLVRLHRFGELDEGEPRQTPVNKLPSQTAMLDLASIDPRVTAEMVGVDFDAVMSDEIDDSSWKLKLRRAPRSGKFVDCIQNWDLVVDNDPLFQKLYFNEMSLSPELSESPPWRQVTKHSHVVSNVDRWEFVHYIEREYGIAASRARIDALIDTKAGRQTMNPVREYLEGLTWDGTPRVEECLPGVEPTDWTRRVARMVLAAAVARIYDPGCKWDHTLVLFGLEGLGKSWWIDRLARGYTASLGRLDNKDTLLTLQRSWIVVADEGHSLRKDDQDIQKEFLTRTADVFRMPYDRETVVHPRHCVIWSTTNDETFLRRQEGNRRFLIVQCANSVDFDSMTDYYVDQLWAEAVHLYQAGEPLFFRGEEKEKASAERERFVEEDSLVGVIQEYLDQKVPVDWWDKSPDLRQQWRSDHAQGFEPDGIMEIDRVCSRQIWVEAMGQRMPPRRTDLLDITNALRQIPGWEAVPDLARIPGYGPQRTFIRKDLL